MYNINIGGAIAFLAVVAFLLGLCVWGVWELIDFFFIEDGILSPELIEPEIRLVVKDNIVDTLYYYQEK